MRRILFTTGVLVPSLFFLTSIGISWEDSPGMALKDIEIKMYLSTKNPLERKKLTRDLKRQSEKQCAPEPTVTREIGANAHLTSFDSEGFIGNTEHSSIKFLEIEGRVSAPRHEKGKNGEEAVDAKNDLVMYTEEKIREQLRKQARELGLEPRLALSMAKVESGYNPLAVSPKGAIGVLQVMPKLAWEDFKISRERLFEPKINIRVGLSRIKFLLNRFDQNLDLSLAAYNAGASRVVRAGYKVPPIRETQSYVRKVKESMENEV